MSAVRSRRRGATTAAVVAVEPGSTGNQTSPPPNFRVPRAWGSVAVGVQGQATYPSGVGGAGTLHPLLDLHSVLAWRVILALAAAAYVFGFHVTLGPLRLRVK